MLTFRQVSQTDHDLVQLVELLDRELHQIYGKEMSNYTPHNTLSSIHTAIVMYEDSIPVACGAFRVHEPDTIEIKRMYVRNGRRGKGYSKILLLELEHIAREQGYTTSILETGIKQEVAMQLYGSLGYEKIPNYGPYVNLPNSVCYTKKLL
jgi:GNAT superfamily N-acetyltransferase